MRTRSHLTIQLHRLIHPHHQQQLCSHAHHAPWDWTIYSIRGRVGVSDLQRAEAHTLAQQLLSPTCQCTLIRDGRRHDSIPFHPASVISCPHLLTIHGLLTSSPLHLPRLLLTRAHYKSPELPLGLLQSGYSRVNKSSTCRSARTPPVNARLCYLQLTTFVA